MKDMGYKQLLISKNNIISEGSTCVLKRNTDALKDAIKTFGSNNVTVFTSLTENEEY